MNSIHMTRCETFDRDKLSLITLPMNNANELLSWLPGQMMNLDGQMLWLKIIIYDYDMIIPGRI